MSVELFSLGEHSSESFYISGGTLGHDAPCYVTRRADADLYVSLKNGVFCYVLTARQMGKSSLMVRTAARLRQEGSTALVLDLTAIGQNVTVEQWYRGVLGAIGEQLGGEDLLAELWREQGDRSPVQRWTKAICKVALDRQPGNVVIFVDEVDAVLNLPFSADEFFAAIRELHNRRAEC